MPSQNLSKKIQKLVNANIISKEQAAKLTLASIAALSNDGIFNQVMCGKLDIRFAAYPHLQEWVEQNRISQAYALNAINIGLSSENLQEPNVIKLVNNDILTVQQAIDLSPSQKRALSNDGIFNQVMCGQLDIRFAAYLHLKEWVEQNRISQDDALNAINDSFSSENLREPNVIRLVNNDILTVQQAITLKFSQRNELSNDAIFNNLIQNGIADGKLKDIPFINDMLTQVIKNQIINCTIALFELFSLKDFPMELIIPIAGMTTNPALLSNSEAENLASKIIGTCQRKKTESDMATLIRTKKLNYFESRRQINEQACSHKLSRRI